MVGRSGYIRYQKPEISNMHTFGSVCYAYVEQKKKLDARRGFL
jgi:hypothetical protein